MNDQELTHIDLFSGIGGFTLAGEWTGFRTVVFCEKEEFCQKVLQERFGGIIADPTVRGLSKQRLRYKNKQPSESTQGDRAIPIIPDIRDFDGTKWRGATLLTGGFPCQPFSVAGKRKGKEDDRHLWPQMFRVIKEAKPRWVLAENVTGIVKLALGQVLSDLEGIGYDFPRDHEGTPIVPVIPACGLNAPHRRYRVWIIAYNEDVRLQGMWPEGKQESKAHGEEGVSFGKNSDAPYSKFKRPISGESQERSRHKKRIFEGNNSHAPDSQRILPQGFNERQGKREFRGGNWEQDWHEVATRFCRVDDGLPDRIHRLKALGNAIVPQVAYEILRHIAWIERCHD